MGPLLFATVVDDRSFRVMFESYYVRLSFQDSRHTKDTTSHALVCFRTRCHPLQEIQTFLRRNDKSQLTGQVLPQDWPLHVLIVTSKTEIDLEVSKW